MDPSHKSPARFLWAERLEDRCLLSGAAPPEHVGGGIAGGPVQVLELDLADEDDGDHAMAPSRLPEKVLAAFNARFPGAELAEAEIDVEEEDDATYGLSAEFEGWSIDVTLTADGRIVEVERAIDTGELPKAVLDWLRKEFPGAQIDEAAVVDASGAVHYEVAFSSPGRQTREAKLSVVGESPTPAPLPAGRAGDRPEETILVSAALNFGSRFAVASAAGFLETGLAQEDVVRGERAASSVDRAEPGQSASAVSAEIANHTQVAVDAASRIIQRPTALEAAFDAVNLSTGALEWLPQLAGVLTDALPADAAAVERALVDLLARIDTLTRGAVSDAVVGRTATRFAVAALFVAAVRLVIELRRRKGQPVLVHNAANSSWSWVVGAPSPQSRR